MEKRGFQQALGAAGVTVATPFGFADEMRVGLRGMVRRVCGRRGVKVYQAIQISYQWRYLFLVVDVEGGKLHWCWLNSMAADELIAAVGGLQRAEVVAALVWDGAPSYRDGNVQGLGFAAKGKVYATLDDKVAALERALTRLETDPATIRSLARWDWIEEAIQQLPAAYAA